MDTQLINWLITQSEDWQIILFFSLIFLFGITELIIPKRNRAMNRRKRWKINFLLTGINIGLLLFLPISFITAAAYAEKNKWGLLNKIELPFLLILLIGFLLRGFISFSTHYMMHKIPFLWRIHRVHHLDTELDISTTVRFHPIEFCINLLIGIPLILIFGLPIWLLLFYELIDVVVTLWSHSNMRLPKFLNRILRYIIVTPDLHAIHHSSFQKETDSNFGAVFPIWDILVGTFKTTTKEDPNNMQIGLKEIRDKRTFQLGWLLISPFKSFKKWNNMQKKE